MMEPIRILHENVIMDPGGIESLLMNIYRNIDRSKLQFDFMVHRPIEGKYEKEIRELGGKIYRTPPFNPLPGKYFMYISHVKKILKEHPEYKILHAHAELNYWPLKVAKEIGIPVRISHSHNARTSFNLKYLFFLYEKLHIKSVCTDMFMCSTPAGEWTYGKKIVAEGKCIFVKNGIEVEKYAFNPNVRADVRKKIGIEDKLVIGHVGRFMQQKNHTFLIDIFNEIHKKCPNAVLILVSDGKLIDEIKTKVASLGIQDSVKFLGFRSDVNYLMQGMDVFLFPSLWEGLPVTAIEAQSAGLPIVMSDVITNEASVTNLVHTMSLSQSAVKWADKVLEVYSNTERKDVSNQVRDNGFDIIATAKWLENFYIRKYNETLK